MSERKYLSGERYKIEESYEGEIRKILCENGFSEIEKMFYQCTYDFEAKYKNKKAFIEVKTRGAKAKDPNIFIIRDRKIDRLKSLTGSGFVFLLFINRQTHRLVRLEHFLEDTINLKPIIVGVHRTKNLGNDRIKKVDNRERRDSRLQIRTTTETRNAFEALIKKYKCAGRHDLLNLLLENYVEPVFENEIGMKFI